jgi:hypothetical protein
VPVPLKALCCGLLDAESTTLSVSVSNPVVVGENCTMIVQLEDAASVDPHVPPLRA